MSVAIERVTHTYQPHTPWSVTALHDVSLRIDDGEAVAIIGATGSGKSTLVQVLAGLVQPTAGQVLVDGVDLWRAPVGERRRLRMQIGLVFQYPEQQVFEETVRADIAFGPKNLGLPPETVERQVRSALAQVGLPEQVLDRSPFELSGGQMRRVAVAGILAMQPQVLVLDEPTAGLDPRGREEILGYIREWHRRDGLTVVLVSHNMEEVARLVDRVVVMDQGRVVLDGPVRTVYAQVDLLQGLGLDVPLAARLVNALAARGWPLPTGVLTTDEAVNVIAGCLARGGSGPVVPNA